jgi:phage portal protein BeeE
MLGSLFRLRSSPFRTADDEADGFMTFGSAGSVGKHEKIEDDYLSRVQRAYKASGPVFACISARAMPFSEARFAYQEIVDGRPGRLTGGVPALLERPWPNGTTGELLWRMEQDGSLAGNCYLTPVGSGDRRRIRRLRPDKVTIVTGINGDIDGDPWALDAEVLAYIYAPGNSAPQLLGVDQVAHYSPIPDPEAQWRGMSWLTPVLEDILGDQQAGKYKQKYFENGTMSNMVVTHDASRTIDELRAFKALFDESYRGVDKAYKTIHLGGGADAKTLSASMKDLDFRALQGAAETRIAAAAGVGAIIARFSEGMQGSSLNAGNYQAAKRQFADMTLRPLWRSAAGATAKLVDVPTGHRNWYDARDVEFLKDDRKDTVEVQSTMASTIASLISAGYDPDAVIDAVEADDLSRLVGNHTGLYSVQLQSPGASDGQSLSVAEQLQKIYLAVDKVITSDEAREIVGLTTPGPTFTPGGEQS